MAFYWQNLDQIHVTIASTFEYTVSPVFLVLGVLIKGDYSQSIFFNEITLNKDVYK